MTRFLSSHERLLTLLRGPYPSSSAKEVLQCDRLLLLGGGIGITVLIPYLRFSLSTKLFFSVREADACLVESLNPVSNELAERDIKIGHRLDINELLRAEAKAGCSKVGVVVGGPAGMCDDARAAVTSLGKETAGVCSFHLGIHSYSW